MSERYAMRFECVEHPWNGACIIFDDGQAKLHKGRLSPDRPVLVQLEGKVPTPEQIDACRRLWAELYEAMDFRVASFCPAL
jgi:hypothetical protein